MSKPNSGRAKGPLPLLPRKTHTHTHMLPGCVSNMHEDRLARDTHAVAESREMPSPVLPTYQCATSRPSSVALSGSDVRAAMNYVRAPKGCLPYGSP